MATIKCTIDEAIRNVLETYSFDTLDDWYDAVSGVAGLIAR